MWQRIPLPFRPSRQQQATHGRRLPNTDRADRRLDVVHGIVYGQPCGDRPAGGVDVEVYRFLGVLGFEKEQLCDDHGAKTVVDRAIETDDAFFEQTGKYIVWR